MSQTFDFGDAAANQIDVIALAVHPGDSIVLKNVAGSTLNVLGNGLNGGATSTIAATASGTFTAPTWITTPGRTSCLITGGVYGA